MTATGSEQAHRVAVARVDEIPPGTRKIVDIDRRSIGVFNLNGEFFAVRNRCPHNGGPLCLGKTTGLTVSDGPGNYDLERDGEILRCPWHGWEFDLRNGRSVCDPEQTRVRSYPVEVVQLQAEMYRVETAGDMVMVCLDRRRR